MAARVGRAEHALELVGRCDLQLIVAAVLRSLVRAPALELGSVTEARALHVVVGDLADALRPQGLPAQILPPIPSAGRAGQTLSLRARFFLRLGPVAPGMTFERVLSQRRQLVHQLLAHRIAERCRDPDVMERPVVVVEAAEERADHLARALLWPPQAADHA